jgi:hypothetical protein
MRGRSKQNGLDTFGGAQPRFDSSNPQGENNRPSTAPPPLGNDAPHPGGHFSSATWQRERILRLARIFRCVEQGRKSGKRLHRQLVRFARRWNGKRYNSDSARSMHLTYPTLVRLYYLWRAGGKSALETRYHGPKRKIGSADLRTLLELCLRPDISGFSAAYRQLPAPLAGESSYRRAVRIVDGGMTTRLFFQRRKVASTERVARRLLAGLAGQLQKGKPI